MEWLPSGYARELVIGVSSRGSNRQKTPRRSAGLSSFRALDVEDLRGPIGTGGSKFITRKSALLRRAERLLHVKFGDAQSPRVVFCESIENECHHCHLAEGQNYKVRHQFF
ncbi:hypothetical protein TNCV_523431 [Trichonephila clavipes]|nr:hypothetical protein TNCV_523431 [Trichonephila clavipes]